MTPVNDFHSFFQELANLSKRGRRVDEVAAGLLTMRATSAWLEGETLDSEGATAISTAVESLEENSEVQRRLHKLLDGSRRARDSAAIAGTLQDVFDYGLQLENDAAFSLAAEVFGFVAHQHFASVEMRAVSFLRQSYCFRRLGIFRAALGATRRARSIARQSGDRSSYLRSFIGDAQVLRFKGHFSDARRLLRRVSVRARRWGLRSVLAKALHDRACIAGLETRYERSARLAFAALRLTSDPADRERIILDLATSCLRLGLLDIAHDLFLELSLCASDQSIRWNSLMNLVEVASLNRDTHEMRVHELSFEGAELPPNILASYHVTVGQAYARVGMHDVARDHLLRALAVATEHGFDNYVVEATNSLAGQIWAPPAEPHSPIIAELMTRLNDEIHFMRRHARDRGAAHNRAAIKRDNAHSHCGKCHKSPQRMS